MTGVRSRDRINYRTNELALSAFGTMQIAARRDPVDSAHKSKSDTLSGGRSQPQKQWPF
jgi:hypothetical protein